jgi:hypothetical protein
MPALPWHNGVLVGSSTEVTVLASRLPLRSHRDIPSFLRWTVRIRGQLAATPGLIGYALDSQLLRKTFWTVSAWKSQNDLAAFNRASPHSDAVAVIRARMDPTTFVTWRTTAAQLPISWHEVRSRLDEAMNATPQGQ